MKRNGIWYEIKDVCYLINQQRERFHGVCGLFYKKNLLTGNYFKNNKLIFYSICIWELGLIPF